MEKCFVYFPWNFRAVEVFSSISPSHLRINYVCTWTPPQKGPFWGGYVFRDFFHEFFRYEQNFFGEPSRDLNGPSTQLSADRSAISAANRILKFQKYVIFDQNYQLFETFFFKMRFLSKIAQKWLKMIFCNFFRS